MPDYDVIIVGGGMVGGCLALALRQSSLRVAVIEARPADDKQDDAGKRAIALSWGSRCLLEQLGLWSKLQPEAVPIEQIHVSDKGHFGKTRLSATSQSVDALGYVVAAEKIEAAVEADLAAADFDLYCPAELRGYQVKDDVVQLEIDCQEGRKYVSCYLLVGADGGSSSVRELGCFDVQQKPYRQQAVTALLRVESEPQGVAYERFTDEGPIAMLPHTDGNYSLVWTLPSELAQQVIRLPKEEFEDRLQQRFGQWLGGLSLLGACQSFPLNLSYVTQSYASRVVLIGNAAHQLHPVAGQGFNLGLRDAAMLADVLMAPPQDIGSDLLLEKYAEQRQADQALVIGFTDNVVKLFSTSNGLLSTIRNSGLLLMDKWPLLKNKFAQQTMGLATRLPRLKGK